jgi:hypothetical protein
MIPEPGEKSVSPVSFVFFVSFEGDSLDMRLPLRSGLCKASERGEPNPRNMPALQL